MPMANFLSENQEQFERDLFELLSIASVSADGEFAPHVRQAATWVAEHLAGLGLSVETIETDGNPIIYAESPPVPGKPVALVYGHYDVQPPDPLADWISPPFEPTVRDGAVYARGATDDKGQMLTHVKAAQALLAEQGELPLQIKFVIEGEEEVGSGALSRILPEYKEKLACDVIIVSDMPQFGPGQPAITYALRGIAVYELRLTGPKQDLHSGSFGGSVTNPAVALCRLMASLVDAEGRIQIPGFYDDVKSLSETERIALGALPFDQRSYLEQLGVEEAHGERGYSTLERRWARPSLDINGLTSGYQKEGSKTIVPSTATAKFSFRLVPNQDPAKIGFALRTHLAENCLPGVKMELVEHHTSSAVLADTGSDYITAAVAAIEKGFGKSPVLIREGGSVPIVAEMAQTLDAGVLMLGWGLPDDNTHSPNEKFCLADYHRAIKASAALYRELGKLQK